MDSSEQSRAVAGLVRAGDRDRYLTALFAPQPKRPALLALYALNVELARIGESVSEPMMGEIRLQWWRDALRAAEQGNRTGHPVADALGPRLDEPGLSKPMLLGLIDARAFDISGAPMPDMAALRAYLNKTAGALFALSAGLLAGEPIRTGPAIEDAALAYGLTGLMRALPLHAARGRLDLPHTHLTAHGVAAHDILTGKGGAGLTSLLAALRGEAREAHARARAGLAEMPQATRPAFLPLALVEPYLRALERPDHRPLREIAEIGAVRRLWRLTAAAAVRGRV